MVYWADFVIAELDVFGSLRSRNGRLELVANTFFTGFISEDAEPFIGIFCSGGLAVSEKGNGVAVNGDSFDVSFITGSVISFIFSFGFALFFCRFMGKNGVKGTVL